MQPLARCELADDLPAGFDRQVGVLAGSGILPAQWLPVATLLVESLEPKSLEMIADQDGGLLEAYLTVAAPDVLL